MYLIINRIVHNPAKLYLYNESDCMLDETKEYVPEDVPRHYVYDHESDKFDAYALMVWGKGAECVEKHEATLYFIVTTGKSIFDLTDYLEERLSINNTTELFNDWSAHRRGSVYYLATNVYTVSDVLADAYIANIVEWCSQNGSCKAICPVSIPELSRTDDEYKCEIEVLKEDIKSLEKSGNLCENCAWDMLVPEYEGGGDNCDLLPGLLDIVPKVVSLIAAFIKLKYNIKIESTELLHDMEKCSQKIIKKFRIEGELRFPAREEMVINNKGNRVYHFCELDKGGNEIAKYSVVVRKLSKWKHYYATKIEK